MNYLDNKYNKVVTSEHPASVQQRRFWFIDQYVPASPLFNLSAAYRLRGPLNRTALEQSLNALVQRHEVLRTSFVSRNGEVFQVVKDHHPFQLSFIELDQSNTKDQQARIEQLAKEEAATPFDTENEQLFRATLVRIHEHEHLFMLTAHHLISDGWSGGIIATELGHLYKIFCNQQDIQLPQPALQYKDYANRQIQWLQSETVHNQLTYWEETLSGQLPVFPVLSGRTRPSSPGYNGQRELVSIGASLTAGIKQIARSSKSTLFMALLAAFKVLVYKYSGHKDIIVGSPTANRQDRQLLGVMGLFVNSLAYRSAINPEANFTALLSQVRQTVIGALKHQDVPFEQLVEVLQPERETSYQPIIQSMFSLQPRGLMPQFEGLETTTLKGGDDTPFISTDAAAFELSIMVSETNGAIHGFVEYSTDLYTSEEIRRLWQHYLVLLQEIVDQPDAPISRLSILTESEKHQQLVQWQGPVVEIPDSTNLKTLFEEQAAQRPGKVAVVCEEESITYQELNSRANQLAHYLREQGAGTDILVGICIDRSIEMVIAMLATVKAGAAYMPMDPSLPAERLSYMLNDSEAQLLIAHSDVDVPDHGGQSLFIDTQWPDISTCSEENPPHRIAPESLVYVIYTSGSTGRPKGVELPHRAFVNVLIAGQQEPGITEDGVSVNTATFSFDIAGSEIFLPLISGATLVVASRKTTFDGEALAALLDHHHATYMQGTHSLLSLLLGSGWKGSPDLRVMTGGEPLSSTLRDKLLSRVHSLWNMYGPTEAAIWVTGHEVKQSDKRIPIGVPIANTQIYVLDEDLALVPTGIAGCLYIGGQGLARGYRNRPELTATKFIDNPFGEDLLYRTGDLVRWLPTGKLEFVGREDDQIKIRGFRVELGEIEETMRQIDGVDEVCVLLREDRQGNKQLFAYLRAAADYQVHQDTLRDTLKHWLPAYMIPSIFVALEKMPLTSTGKIDRAALPVPGEIYLEPTSSYDGPRNELEAQLAIIWEDILGIKPIGIHHNFFDLGGHSLLVMQVLSRIQVTLDRSISVSAFFEFPTISQLADHFNHHYSQVQSEPVQEIVSISRDAYRMSSSDI